MRATCLRKQSRVVTLSPFARGTSDKEFSWPADAAKASGSSLFALVGYVTLPKLVL